MILMSSVMGTRFLEAAELLSDTQYKDYVLGVLEKQPGPVILDHSIALDEAKTEVTLDKYEYIANVVTRAAKVGRVYVTLPDVLHKAEETFIQSYEFLPRVPEGATPLFVPQGESLEEALSYLLKMLRYGPKDMAVGFSYKMRLVEVFPGEVAEHNSTMDRIARVLSRLWFVGVSSEYVYGRYCHLFGLNYLFELQLYKPYRHIRSCDSRKFAPAGGGVWAQ